MSLQRKGVLLLALQLVLVCSVAGKFLYERWTCPRVWTQVQQFDPVLPLRGRYLALNMTVNACSLDKSKADHAMPSHNQGFNVKESWRWPAVYVVASGGHLVLVPAPSHAENSFWFSLNADQNCANVPLQNSVDYYIPESAKSPYPLPADDDLWAEVTVPPKGLPRPIQLAISSNGKFTPLSLH